ncbi:MULTISPECIES: GIY-YIG nuclease family protein [Bacillus]|uniref:GIY-YIG nuclease family protein n=2 Tax=Bacillus cereus group TaxID=86661 RepID=A0AAW9JP33_BACTU|nr:MULTISPECIES: GIY-YIG nuclease family protein [Bacillus]MDZ5480314.1 GIY-YIG nuclease family protein [Bacillus thuringiensis]RKN53307.1 GIY-YIG nuclease family protein [Bacillus sp. S66]
MDFLYLLPFIVIVYIILIFIFQVRQQKKIREQIFGLANNTLELTTKEFLEMRNKSFGGKGRALYSNNYNFAGVYILHNKSKDLYYVGQGKQVLNRVNNHFTGKGNGDVYADYKYGDYWTIKMIALEKSGFNTLNELERYAIETYDAYKRGYNKTRGNK